MKLSLMHLLDYWIGVPLCFFLSGIDYLVRLFRPTTVMPPTRTVFVELSEMGSAILAYPALLKYRSLFPESEIFFLTFSRNKSAVSILEMFPNEKILTIDDKSFLSFVWSFAKIIL